MGVITLLNKYGKNSDILQRYFVDYLSSLESGQRSILYYLSTRLSVRGITDRHGPQSYVYLNRLMNMGYIIKLPGRRGNYLVRNPLIRMIFNVLFRGEDFYWYTNGYLYLIMKILQSINTDISLSTPTYTLYLSRISRVKRIDRWNCRLMDGNGSKYSIHFTWEEDPDVKGVFKYDEDIKILIYPYTSTMDLSKKMKRNRVVLLDYNDIVDLANNLGFVRRL